MFLIRADGNAEIGAGHLMRCLTIADALRRYVDRCEMLFVCADRHSAELAQSRGYETFILESDPRDMEGELSAWLLIPGIKKETNDILVDSYFVTEHYLCAVREYGSVTLLDDMGEKYFPVDRIINYNVFADREKYERLYRNSGTELILGSAYVPLRPQFHGKTCKIREQARNILITTGGGDSNNIAGQILRRIREKAAGIVSGDRSDAGRTIKDKMTGEVFQYHLITGRFNPYYEELKALGEQSSDIRIYHNVQDMAGLMVQCDLAVTAGGSTVYELAAAGVPFICFSYAENQEKITEFLHREKIAFSAGKYHRDPDAVLERIAEQAITLSQDHRKRRECCLRERKLADGLGAERLAKLLAGPL